MAIHTLGTDRGWKAVVTCGSEACRDMVVATVEIEVHGKSKLAQLPQFPQNFYWRHNSK